MLCTHLLVSPHWLLIGAHSKSEVLVPAFIKSFITIYVPSHALWSASEPHLVIHLLFENKSVIWCSSCKDHHWWNELPNCKVSHLKEIRQDPYIPYICPSATHRLHHLVCWNRFPWQNWILCFLHFTQSKFRNNMYWITFVILGCKQLLFPTILQLLCYTYRKLSLPLLLHQVTPWQLHAVLWHLRLICMLLWTEDNTLLIILLRKKWS